MQIQDSRKYGCDKVTYLSDLKICKSSHHKPVYDNTREPFASMTPEQFKKAINDKWSEKSKEVADYISGLMIKTGTIVFTLHTTMSKFVLVT